MKRFAATYLALLVLVILGAYIYFNERGEPVTSEEAARILVEASEDAIEAVEIALREDPAGNGSGGAGGPRTGGSQPEGSWMASSRLLLERDPGNPDQWALVVAAPEGRPAGSQQAQGEAARRFDADPEQARRILQALAGLRAERRLGQTSELEGLAAYGLDNPRLTVKVTDKDGKTAELRIGDSTPTGSYYATTAEGDAVFTVSSVLVSDVEKRPEDVRSRRLVPEGFLGAEAIEVVAHAEPGGAAGGRSGAAAPSGAAGNSETAEPAGAAGARVALRLFKDENLDWQLVSPVVDDAEDGEASDLVWRFATLRAEEFVNDQPESLAPYGLDSPWLAVTLWQDRSAAWNVGSDGSAALTIWLGAQVPDAENQPGGQAQGGAEPESEDAGAAGRRRYYAKTTLSPSVYVVQLADEDLPVMAGPAGTTGPAAAGGGAGVAGAEPADGAVAAASRFIEKDLAGMYEYEVGRLVVRAASGQDSQAGAPLVELAREGEEWKLKGDSTPANSDSGPERALLDAVLWLQAARISEGPGQPADPPQGSLVVELYRREASEPGKVLLIVPATASGQQDGATVYVKGRPLAYGIDEKAWGDLREAVQGAIRSLSADS